MVCPGEKILIYCATNGTGLLWGLPIEQNNLVSFFTDDPSPAVQRKGSIMLWRDKIQPLSSTVMVPYSPELNNTNFACESGGETWSLQYKLASMYAIIVSGCQSSIYELKYTHHLNNNIIIMPQYPHCHVGGIWHTGNIIMVLSISQYRVSLMS